jgi:peptidoglycan/LPS O-acetylase OafA/YrhL
LERPVKEYVKQESAIGSLWAGRRGLTSVPRTASSGSGASEYIPTLDGWRAIAILAVIFHHATLPLLSSHPWLKFTEQGAMGVDVFFALSGFLICSRLLEERAREGFIDLKAFYLRRVFRILPPYLTYLVVLFVMVLFGMASSNLADWLSCLTFTRNYLPNALWTWRTAHFWSLSVEEHFYLVFPGVLILIGPRHLRRLLPFFVLAATVWRMIDYRFHLFDRLYPGVPFLYRSDIRLDGIALGALAALLVAVPGVKTAIQKQLTSLRILFAVGALLVVTFIAISMGVLWQRVLIAGIITATALRPDLIVTKWFEARWLRWIGRLSYSLYIWQQMFFVPTRNALSTAMIRLSLLRSLIPDDSDRAWILQLPLLCVGTLTMAVLSYYFVEQPVLRWGGRYLKARRMRRNPQMVAVAQLAPGA